VNFGFRGCLARWHGAPVGVVEKLDDVHNPAAQALAAEPCLELRHAAWVRSRDYVRARRLNRRHFVVE
jgi:hypothetical protein